MKFNNIKVMNFENAIRGLRNPLESWSKSDSKFGLENLEYFDQNEKIAELYANKQGFDFTKDYDNWSDIINPISVWLNNNGILNINDNDIIEYALIGPNDLDLAQRMIKAGDSDSKFMRQILVSIDITAPLYWWKEMDQYRIGVTTNSTSTMHKIASTPIIIDCFETDDYNGDYAIPEDLTEDLTYPIKIINYLEYLRKKYNETKDQHYWKELIRWLPESWLQTRTWTANYAILRNIYFQRQHHRLTEWGQFCKMVESLPYAKELILYNDKN